MKKFVAVGLLTVTGALGIGVAGATQAHAGPWGAEGAYNSRAYCNDAGNRGLNEGRWSAYYCDGPDGPGRNVLFVHWY